MTLTQEPSLKIGVVGCGQMGAGIAEVCARAGSSVIVVETSAATVQLGRDRLAKSLVRAEKKGLIKSAGDTLLKIDIVTDLESLNDRQIVIEAVAEDEGLKVELFKKLDQIVQDPTAILASNTSSIPIMKLAVSTERPQQVLGIHFFNPAPVLQLVELVPSLFTAPAVIDQARSFVQGKLGKHAIQSQDRAGFIVNALLIPFILSAIRMMESGFATPDDIDQGMVLGCAHPQGPLALADLIGLDTTQSIAESLYEEFREPTFAPPPILARMVEAGLLGRKSGRGFFSYD